MLVTLGWRWSRPRRQWVTSACRHLYLVFRNHALCSSRGCDDAAELTVCSATTCSYVFAMSWAASSAVRRYHLTFRSSKHQCLYETGPGDQTPLLRDVFAAWD